MKAATGSWSGGDFKRPLLMVLCLALLVRAVVFAANFPFPPLAKDDAVYETLARNLFAGNGFSDQPSPPFRPMAVRTPGYPAFIGAVYSVVGRRPDAVRIMQIALATVTCILIFLLVRRVVGVGAALVATGMYALLPAAALYTSQLLTEANTALLLVAAVLCVYRCLDAPLATRWYVGCAVLLAAATMHRPDYQFLIVPLFACVLWQASARKSTVLRQVAIGMLVFVALLAPWLVRNYVTLDGFVGLSTGTGHTAMTAKFEAEGLHGPALRQAFEERYGQQFRMRYGRQMTYLDGALPDQDELRRRDFREFVRSQPMTYLRHSISRVAVLWGPRSWSDAAGIKSDFGELRAAGQYGALSAKFLLLFVDAVVLGLAAIGSMFAAFNWRRFLPIFVVLVYASAVYGLVYSGARYRAPLLPLVVVLSAYGGWRLFTLRERSTAPAI